MSDCSIVMAAQFDWFRIQSNLELFLIRLIIACCCCDCCSTELAIGEREREKKGDCSIWSYLNIHIFFSLKCSSYYRFSSHSITIIHTYYLLLFICIHLNITNWAITIYIVYTRTITIMAIMEIQSGAMYFNRFAFKRFATGRQRLAKREKKMAATIIIHVSLLLLLMVCSFTKLYKWIELCGVWIDGLPKCQIPNA